VCVFVYLCICVPQCLHAFVRVCLIVCVGPCAFVCAIFQQDSLSYFFMLGEIETMLHSKIQKAQVMRVMCVYVSEWVRENACV